MEEAVELQALLTKQENEQEVLSLMQQIWERPVNDQDFNHEQRMSVAENILQKYPPARETAEIRSYPAHNRTIGIKKWWYVAAAVLFLFAGYALYHQLSPGTLPNNKITRIAPTAMQPVILPGYNRAILTLSNGQKVLLDSAAAKTIEDGNVSIGNNEGQLAYFDQNSSPAQAKAGGRKSEPGMMNTMSTPKGGQYRLILPDGTKVWLNAASSITFPVVFTGGQRRVTVNGELYFDVAKNHKQPFIVDINEKSRVEVLGTGFNINSYEDEGAIKTTLLEGSIKINAATILKPGQQAIIMSDKESPLVQQADIIKTLAWKNGMFDFNDADLHSVMHQLERWYDITIKYEPGAPNPVFKGRMYRNADLSEVLKMLKKMGIRLQLDGKVLTINK